ncbi:MAG: GNAT family N-acetyltransferase [Gammaproteobacteria bacterium]
MTARPYTSQDQPDVVELILPIQQREFGLSISLEDQPDLLNIPDFYQQGNGNFWVAQDEYELAGTIALLDIGNHQVALRKMFVKAGYRGAEEGVAKRLLDTALRWCRRRGIKAIYLGTTAQFLAAHRFYEKHGFALIDKKQLPERFPIMAVDTRFYRFNLDSDSEGNQR